MNISSTKDILEIFVASITIIGGIISLWKFFLVPAFVKYIKEPISKINKIDETTNIINEEILPVIRSLNKEFSKNSGKSISDRILRIDDNTRLSELRTKLLASNMVTTGILEFDKNGQLIWANKAFLNMIGLELEQVKYNGWAIGIEEEERDKVWKLWMNSIANNIPFESEFLLKNQSNNNSNQVKCTILPHKSVDGSILGYHGTVVIG